MKGLPLPEEESAEMEKAFPRDAQAVCEFSLLTSKSFPFFHRQPHGLSSTGNRTACQLQRPIHIPLLNKDATEMEPCKIRGMTQRLAARTGAGWQEHIFSFRSREQNVLYISSYRSGVSSLTR